MNIEHKLRALLYQDFFTSMEEHDKNDPILQDRPADYTAEILNELDEKYGEDLWEVQHEFMWSGIPTSCIYQGDYPYQTHARQLPDGTWIAWPCFFGGGKHYEVEAWFWMEQVMEVEPTGTSVTLPEFKEIEKTC